MKVGSIVMILCGITLIVFPDIIAYLLGGALVFFGISGMMSGALFSFVSKNKKENGKSYVQVGEYKIFR
ncbi:hypothetical protein MK079_00480 [Candidatus Gracilibacteria bacterium]|nr:hypothetical protein [Candidatus Gracilibacteria bacterium]